jgi:Carboxypeptidase regulatory-like domain
MFRTIRKTVWMAIAFAGLITLSSPLTAQQTGSLVGTVADKTGAVIPNAKVTLSNLSTKDIRYTVTNGEGFFAFNGVVTGDYAIKIESQGFREKEQAGIHLSPGDRRNISAMLEVGTGAEQVTVQAEPSQIQIVDSGERSSVLSAKDIKSMALEGRDVTELIKVLPGFNNTTGGGGLGNYSGYDPTVTGIGSAVGNGYSASGTPNRTGTALTSDGANVIDVGCNCNSTQTINADMVQEVKVSTSAFGADNAKGPVVIQAVGKSGSAEYHGGAYLHFRDSSMNSTDWDTNYNKVQKPNDRYWYPDQKRVFL